MWKTGFLINGHRSKMCQRRISRCQRHISPVKRRISQCNPQISLVKRHISSRQRDISPVGRQISPVGERFHSFLSDFTCQREISLVFVEFHSSAAIFKLKKVLFSQQTPNSTHSPANITQSSTDSTANRRISRKIYSQFIFFSS